MPSFIQRLLRLSTLGALALGVMQGCADEQESLIVRGAVGFDDMCVVNPTTLPLARGTLDASFGTAYSAGIILYNQLAPQMTNNSGTDNSELQLIDADVDLSIPQAPQILANLRARDPSFVSFTQPLPTNSLQGQQEVAVLVDVITAAASRALAEEIQSTFSEPVEITVVADIVFHAERTGNSVGKIGDIEARTYSFPIDVGLGNLISCATCENAACPDTTNYVIPCGNAQDAPVVPGPCASAN